MNDGDPAREWIHDYIDTFFPADVLAIWWKISGILLSPSDTSMSWGHC